MTADPAQVLEGTAEESAAAEFATALADREARAARIAALTDAEVERVLFDWTFWRRPGQAPPSDWLDVWLILAGRGYGKTRTGAETVRENVEAGAWGRVALVGPTAADVRDVMVEGESGLLAVSPPGWRPEFVPSKRRLTWPNGAVAFTYSAEEPERLRGPQHDGAWGDEPAAWRYGKETFDNLRFGLRLGDHPRAILTGTPKPIVWLRSLIASGQCVVTRGSLYENAANLADVFLKAVLAEYEGTRLGRQEIWGLMLDDVEGTLWTSETIEAGRVALGQVPPLSPIVVAVDPPGSTTGAECGIIVAGREATSADPLRRHAYVLDDRSRRGSAEEWAQATVDAVRDWGAAYVIAEVNFGGDMVKAVIHAVDPTINVKVVRATRSKTKRAEPVATLYSHDPARVHHVGDFGTLESQMTTWVPPDSPDAPKSQPSPDRMDALVWAVSHLLPPAGVVMGSATAPTGSGAAPRRPAGSSSTGLVTAARLPRTR